MKSKLDEIIKKHETYHANLTANYKRSFDTNTQEENDHYEQMIRFSTEILHDLKNLLK